MKKGILLLAFGMTCLMTKAQVVFNVNSPANLAGNRTLTYSAGAGWGSPDLLDPLNSITGNLVLADDGTTADSLACNALINGAAMNGNIAILYRGSCEFGTKSLNAQNAGAIGVVIINNIPGDPVGMGGGADGTNVTIPVAMISQFDGATLINAMAGGAIINVFIGSKLGLYDTDLGFTTDRMLLPNPNSNHTLIAQNGSEHNFRIGSWVYNFGKVTQTGAKLQADVTFGGTSVYSNQMTVPSINMGDTLFVELPVFSPSTYAVGTYTLTYTLTTVNADEDAVDNTFTTDFFISDKVYSYVKLDVDQKPIATTGYRTAAATTTFSSCIHVKNANASRVETNGIYFAASTNTTGTLALQEINTVAYEWNDFFTDVNDAAITDIVAVGNGTYTYADNTLQSQTVFAPFSTPFVMKDDQSYLFCVTTYDANTYIGYGDLDYSLVLDTYLQPLFPIQTDAGYNVVGFGGEVPSIGVNMYTPGSNKVSEESISNISIYPNPAKSMININGSDLIKYQTVELKDQLGRTISSWKVNSNLSVLDVSKLANGNYLLVLSGQNGSLINKVQINN